MGQKAARYRAARAYAGLEQEELASRLGVGRQTVVRRESDNPEVYKPPRKAEWIALAEISGVPIEFLLEGFGGRARDEISERLAALDEALRDLQRELAVLSLGGPPRNGEADQPDEGSQGG